MLDNCEHVVSSCAEFTDELLAADRAVVVLTTSREPLGVPGEITWRVPSLGCPEPERSLDVSTLSQFDAVALFLERAHRARPSFAVTDANVPAIAQICYRLDGIPLALELAAARCRQLSPERIASELDDRFRLLTGGARTVMARQQTLAASIDWSHERLDELEQSTFRRLGVFAGVFPLEAAEAVVVAAPGGPQVEEVFDVLSRLVDKSLVVAGERGDGELQYQLLQTLRAYAVDRARAADELNALRDAHASWWTDWLEPSFAMPTDDMLDQVAEFHDNVRAALEWATTNPALGLRLLRVVARLWTQIGCDGDAVAAADRLLSATNAGEHTDAWLAAAQCSADLYMAARGPHERQALLDRIRDATAEVDNEYHRAFVDDCDGQRASAERLRDLARERGDHYLVASITIALAQERADDDPSAAVLELAEAAALARTSTNRFLRTQLLITEAIVARGTGDLRRCIALGQQLLARPVDAPAVALLSPMSFAGLLACDGETLRLAADAGDRERLRAPGLASWADTAALRLRLFESRRSHPNPEHLAGDHPVTPSSLWLACREAIDAGNPSLALESIRRLTRPVPHGLAVLASIEAAATGDDRRWHDALALAIDHDLRLIAVDALEGLAVTASQAEAWAECLRLAGAAGRLREETGYRWRFTVEEEAIDLAQSQSLDGIGHDAAQAAQAEGRGLEWRQAAHYARRARGERKRPHHGWASLTPTELQVAAYVAGGLTNDEIAARLFISRSTVKTHLEHIFAKLGIRSRAELAAQASQHDNT